MKSRTFAITLPLGNMLYVYRELGGGNISCFQEVRMTPEFLGDLLHGIAVQQSLSWQELCEMLKGQTVADLVAIFRRSDQSFFHLLVSQGVSMHEGWGIDSVIPLHSPEALDQWLELKRGSKHDPAATVTLEYKLEMELGRMVFHIGSWGNNPTEVQFWDPSESEVQEFLAAIFVFGHQQPGCKGWSITSYAARMLEGRNAEIIQMVRRRFEKAKFDSSWRISHYSERCFPDLVENLATA